MKEDKAAKLNKLVKERWSGSFSVETYKYIASYYLSEFSLDDKKILDIGCGNGLLLATNCIISNPSLAVGLDSYEGEGSPLADYDFAEKMRLALSLPFFKVIKGNALELPFEDGSFDVVFASQFLHHIYVSSRHLRDENENSSPLIFAVLREIYRCLSDEGVLVVIDAPRYTVLRITKLFGLFKDVDYQTKQEPRDWMYALEKVGFKNFKIKYYTPYPLRFLKWIFSNSIFRYLICGQYYIFAYKNDLRVQIKL